MPELQGYHALAFIQSPLGDNKNINVSVEDGSPELETHDETLFDNPQFQHYEQTSNIQLFFDLFFVANLTSFTDKHEVNSTQKLSSYIGFFCILWFTWCQVTLYDVRFSTDSVFERICHVCHFGAMVALAVVGPQFNDPKLETPWATEQQLSLILMADRLVLLVQYSTTLFFTWPYRKTRLPVFLVMASLAVAAIVYLALSFVFSNELSVNAYLAWYVICVFEVGANIAIAGRWHVVSFKGTHLVERMTCLTLIILGEGVIGLLKSIVKIEDLDFAFSQAAIGTIIASLFIIYFTYQLYFDNVQLEHFGTIRQQIWTFLHFPFHIALVLMMEGINQFVSWRHVMEYVNTVMAPIENLPDDATVGTEALYLAWNDTISAVVDNDFLPLDELQFETVLFDWNNTFYPGTLNVTAEQVTNSTIEILSILYESIFNGYGFEPPVSGDGTEEAITTLAQFNDKVQEYENVFTLIFGYFYICSGLVLISISVLSWLSLLREERKGPESRRAWIGIISNFVLGVGSCLLSIMVGLPQDPNGNDSLDKLGDSAWPLPVMVFILFIALLLNHIPRGISKIGKNGVGKDGRGEVSKVQQD